MSAETIKTCRDIECQWDIVDSSTLIPKRCLQKKASSVHKNLLQNVFSCATLYFIAAMQLISAQSSNAFIIPSMRISSMHHRKCELSLESTTRNIETHIETEQIKKVRRFATRPADNLRTQYDEIVRGAYVRHVVFETEHMADLAIVTYLDDSGASTYDAEKDSESLDPFGQLAQSLSVCVKTRDEAGKIGWIDNPFHPSHIDAGENHNAGVQGLISTQVIEELFQARPKGGDILKIAALYQMHNNAHARDFGEQKRWHLCRIDDLLIDYIQNTVEGASHSKGDGLDFKQRGYNKVITSRPKLKGSGIVPSTPEIIKSGQILSDSTSIEAKSYHIATSGCQMNVSDSERLAGILENDLKLTASNDPSKADIVILNTCSIRDHAEQKVYDLLGPYAARKRQGEPIALIVAGCVAQQEGEALLKRVPEVDLVMGPQYVNRLGDLLDDVSRGHQVVATDPTLLSEDLSRPIRGHAMRAWVNVIYGCNEHCTYCVVPGVRGVEQSRPLEGILKEVLELADAGYKEITLLGQNIDAYGRDMVPKRNFADLLHFLNGNIPDGTIERIRYVTSHPKYFSDRVIDAVASLDKVCECFHMPFQSGDDKVLQRMRRGYSFNSYMKIIHKIRKQSPDASICGDVIVGFPGESDEAFQRTLDLMEAVKYDNLNTFAYSPRPNTEAALWTDQVPEDVKAERLQIVQRLAAQHGMERSERYLGQTVDVLVEGRNPKKNLTEGVMGRTRQNRQVFFDGNIDELQGKTVPVEIIEARPWSLMGKMVL